MFTKKDRRVIPSHTLPMVSQHSQQRPRPEVMRFARQAMGQLKVDLTYLKDK